ncbi:hypothetical protein BDV12DRAFT_169957 [Aspergillus spectabilis]
MKRKRRLGTGSEDDNHKTLFNFFFSFPVSFSGSSQCFFFLSPSKPLLVFALLSVANFDLVSPDYVEMFYFTSFVCQ